MKKFILFLTITILSAISSCKKESDIILTFVGDSLIECWDTNRYFSSWVTTNDGLSGARIDYIESLAGKYIGKDLVILIGTNNYFLLTEETVDEFVEQYLNAVKELGFRHAYLISLLPRDPKTVHDNVKINDEIKYFNSAIERYVAEDSTITYINVFNEFYDGKNIRSKLYLDGLHLNKEGYELLTHLVKKAVKNSIVAEV